MNCKAASETLRGREGEIVKIERDLCKHNHVLKWKCGALNKSYISPVSVV